MANNYIPGTTNATLIADGGIKTTPTPTKVGGDKVNAVLELQTTTRAPIFMKPMTTAQIAAIPNPTNGMEAFDSDLGRFVQYYGGAWNVVNSVLGVSYKTINLTTAQIQGMSAAPVEVLAAPGAGLTYVIHGFKLSITYATALFAGGGAIGLQYDVTALKAGQDASNELAATFLTATAASKFAYVTGNDATVVTSAGSLNKSITISNDTAAFTAGGTSTGKVEVWYSIV